ncbi:MAG: hypothetical protein AABW88_00715 [Nanoarchaeota archaeon]
MEQEKIMWVVIGVLIVAVAFVLLFNQPAVAQAGSSVGAMVGGC